MMSVFTKNIQNGEHYSEEISQIMSVHKKNVDWNRRY